MNYRPEIDGLRAISVIAVILYHAGLFSMSGGFVGVDVFFVISGYLITLINLNSASNGSFSIFRFYEKRIRRLFPALLTILIISFIGAYRLLLPFELKAYCQSLISTVGFSSNIFFFLKSNYFDTASDLKPLLHTWSLSLEEQFYLFYPLLLIGFSKKRIFIFLIALISIVSFLSNLFSPPGAGSFYLLHARAWELLAGGILAYIHLTHGISSRYSSYRSLIGIILVLSSFFLIDLNSYHPGPITLLPVFGSLLVLSSDSSNFVNQFLSFSFVRLIGLLSYSLYLIHQPAFVFSRLLKGSPLNGVEAGTVIIISFITSFFVWKFIESPCRSKTFAKNKPFFAILLVGFALLTVLGYQGHKNGGFQERKFSNRPNDFIASFTQDEVMKEITSSCSFDFLCKIHSSTPYTRSVLLTGDSHAIDYVSAFLKRAKASNYEAYFNAMGGCSFLTEKVSSECLQNKRLLLDAIEKKLVTDIIYIANFGDGVESQERIQELQRIIKLSHSKRIRIILFTPRVNFKDSIAEWGASPMVEIPKDQPIKKLSEKWKKFFRLLPKEKIYDQRKTLCKASGRNCFSTEINSGLPLYRDSNHLTVWASDLIFENFWKDFSTR